MLWWAVIKTNLRWWDMQCVWHFLFFASKSDHLFSQGKFSCLKICSMSLREVSVIEIYTLLCSMMRKCSMKCTIWESTTSSPSDWCERYQTFTCSITMRHDPYSDRAIKRVIWQWTIWLKPLWSLTDGSKQRTSVLSLSLVFSLPANSMNLIINYPVFSLC